MRINVNGITRDMTLEEIAELERLQESLPEGQLSLEEQVEALKQDNAYLKEALELLLSGTTEVD